MNTRKLFLTSLLAAATMSVPAYADESVRWDVAENSVYRYTGTDDAWTKGTYNTSGDTITWSEATGSPDRASNKGFVLYFDGNNQKIEKGSFGNTSDGGGIWVTGTNNTVTASLGEWAGSIRVDAGNVLTTSWIYQLKDGNIVANGNAVVNISSGTINLDRDGIRTWYTGDGGQINVTNATSLLAWWANSGTISAKGLGTVTFSALTDIAAGFCIEAAGATVDFNSKTVSGAGSIKLSSGTIQNLTVGNGMTLAVAGNGSLSNVTFSEGSIFNLDAGSSLELSGNVTLGGTINLSSAITVADSVNVTVANSVLFDLSALTGTTSGSTTTFSLISGKTLGTDWTNLRIDNIDLVSANVGTRGASVSFSDNGSVAITAERADLIWNGTSENSTWNTTTTNTNWKNGSSDDSFYTRDNVTFKSLENVVTTVTLENGADITVGDMTVESGNYTLNAGADNSATISGATLTVASGATLTLSNQLEGYQASALRLGFEDISLSGTIRVNTNSTDSWSSLTFATAGANLHLYDIGGNESTTGFIIASIIASAAGTLSSTWGGKMEIGALSGSGNVAVALTETTQWPNNLNVVIGDLSEYSGTLTLTDTATSGALTLSVSSEAIAGTTANIVVGADTTLAVTEGTDNSTSGVNDLTNVTGSGKIGFAAAGNTSPINGDSDAVKAHNVPYSWVTLSNNFTGTLSITSGVVDMLSSQGHTFEGWNDGNSSAINTDRLGGVTLIELNGGGLQFRNATGSFDKNISVASGNGAIRVYSQGNVRLSGEITGAGTLTHTDGGTLTLAGTVNLTGGFTNAAGTTNFNGRTTLGTLSVSGGTLNLNSSVKVTGRTSDSKGFRQQGGTVNLGDGTNAASLTVVDFVGSSNGSANGEFNIKNNAVMTVTGTKTDATVGFAHSFQLAHWSATETFNVEGVLNLSNVSLSSKDGTGVVNVNTGGELNLNAGLAMAVNGGSVRLNLSGGTMNIGASGIAAGQTLNLNSGTIGSLADSWTSSRDMALGGAIVVDTTKKIYTEGAAAAATASGSEVTLNGVLSDASGATGSLTKRGAGTLKLSGNNTFEGGVTISGGRVVAANEGALGTGVVTVERDAELGLVAETTLTVTNGIDLADGAKLVVDLSSKASATETFTLDLVSETALKYNGAAFKEDCTSLITQGIVVLENMNLDGWTQSLSYSGNKLQLTMTIPEPSVFGLLAGLGALALAGTRRRRKKA